MPKFSPKEKQILKNYFTNTEKQIFCLVNLPEVVKGTLFSRYSRSAKDLRRLFLDEFFKEKALKDILKSQTPPTPQYLNLKKAEDFYDRILVGFGDDSISELGGAHIALENISNIAAKVIEDARIGISPLEKSTRYVFFDKKDEKGRYRFYFEPKILKSKHKALYLDFVSQLFSFYSQVVHGLYQFFLSTVKQDKGISQAVFKAACKAKACDIARYILPMAALTNVGLYGNGRAFEYLLTKMYAHPLAEINNLAKEMERELRKIIPSFVKRANDERGKVYQKSLQKAEEQIEKLAQKVKKGEEADKKKIKAKKDDQNKVDLIYWERNPLNQITAHLLFSHLDFPLVELQFLLRKFRKGKKESLFSDLAKERKNRRHKINRAFENTYYTFEIESDIGAFRDLHRHRMLTQQRQRYSTKLGYITPEEIEAAGFKQDFDQIMKKADQVYQKIKKDLPEEAQYTVPFAYRLRYYFSLNLREAIHLTELRSQAQGHPSYRKIAQQIAQQIIQVHPYFKPLFTFVDDKKYQLERLEPFKKLEKKAKKLKKKIF